MWNVRWFTGVLDHRRDGVEWEISKRGEAKEDDRMKEAGDKGKRKEQHKDPPTHGWNPFS